MEIPLNAMEEDRDDAPPPAFTIPMRSASGNTVSLSSLLSSDQGEHGEHEEHEERETRRESPQQHQQHHHQEEKMQRFETNVAPIAVPHQQQQQPPMAHHPRPRGGLANLMNSPMDEDVIMQDPRGHIVGTMSITTESPGGGLTQIYHTQQEAVEAQPQEQKPETVRVEVVEQEEEQQQQPQAMEVDAGAHEVEAEQASPRSTSDSPVPTRQREQSLIEINIQSVVLNDQDLENLKVELQSAIQKYLVAEAKGDSGAPSAKRQKKGKHARKAKSIMTTDESIAEIQNCIQHLNQKVVPQLDSSNVLTEVVQFCLSFCSVLNEKDSIVKIIVKQKQLLSQAESSDGTTTSEVEVNYDATLAALIQKPLYFQLLSVIRRAVVSCGAQGAELVMSQVLEWCLASSSPANWMWVLAFIGQINSFSMVEFLFHELLFRQAGNEVASQFTMPVIEYLVSKNPAQLVDILRDLLEEAALEDVDEVNGKSVPWVVNRLVSIATEFPVFLRACDDSLQFFVTKEFVNSLAPKFYSQSSKPKKEDAQLNGGGSTEVSLSMLLLALVEKRSSEFSYSGFQLVLLLQGLEMATSDTENKQATPRSQLAKAASAFHRQMLVVAEREASRVLLRGIYRFLPYICQSTLRSLRSPQHGEKKTTDRTFDQWRAWLELIARYISKAEVTQHLIEADLMLSEVAEEELPLPTTIRSQDLKLCGLLSSILTPLSVDYVQFAKEMMNTCNASAPRGQQRRVLAILQALLNVNERDDQSSTDQADQLPIELSVPADLTIEDAVDRILSVDSWSQSWKRFELWKGTQGVNFWEGFMDLSCSQDPEVASRALELISETPFQSLEDPIWQYRCLRKLTTVFFLLLRQYRAEIVNSGNHQMLIEKGSETQGCLEKLKVAFFRLLALDGGVAHYPSSVYSTFVSLWVDALFSTNSPTSIPTHFPNRVNFSTQGEIEDRVVIRSERTISSKCTNLQSSKVITQFPETLVYRKALDSSWEREMDAAHTCCMYAADLLFQLLCTSVTTGRAASGRRGAASDNDNEYVERKLKAVVDLLLERAIPCCGIPSDEVYKETLPNRSSFDMDLRTEQWLNHFPAFLPLLRAAVTTSASVNSSQSLRLVPLIKSALVVLLGHWNSVKGELSLENMDVPPYMRNRNQLALTCELVQILRFTGWLPAPLGRTAELLPLTSPADIRGILFSCWFYLSDHPPSETSSGPTPASSRTASPISATSSPAVSAAGGGGGNHANVPLEFYLIPLRKALHNNIRKIGAKYPLYMC